MKTNEKYVVPANLLWPQISRYWVFTINNPKESDYLFVEELFTSATARYVCFGEENFDISDKTPHLQGYVEFCQATRFARLRSAIPRAYVARKRGTRLQARTYCNKECTNFREYGTWVEKRQGERSDLSAVQKRIREGTSMDVIADEHFTLWCRYHRSFELYNAIQVKKRRRLEILEDSIEPSKVYWFYGPTGTGKTREAKRILAELGDFFEKSPGNKWFDGYAGEKYALFDDFRPEWFSWSFLLRITDPYAGYTNVEVKGSIIPFQSKVLIFTSNVNPLDLFDRLPEAKDQLMRRIDCTEFKMTG